MAGKKPKDAQGSISPLRVYMSNVNISPPIPHQKGVPNENGGGAFGALLDTKCFEEMAAAMT